VGRELATIARSGAAARAERPVTASQGTHAQSIEKQAGPSCSTARARRCILDRSGISMVEGVVYGRRLITAWWPVAAGLEMIRLAIGAGLIVTVAAHTGLDL